MQLMRHASISTTLQFYVGSDAEAAARELWREMLPPANDFANSHAGHHGEPDQESQEVAEIPDENE
jgi:hypothetical protein